jgi:hypothetical protein
MLDCRPFHLLLVQVRSYHTYVVREILHHASLRHPFVVSLNQVILTRHVSRATLAAAAQLYSAGAWPAGKCCASVAECMPLMRPLL